jgi:hypothetical protein
MRTVLLLCASALAGKATTIQVWGTGVTERDASSVGAILSTTRIQLQGDDGFNLLWFGYRGRLEGPAASVTYNGFTTQIATASFLSPEYGYFRMLEGPNAFEHIGMSYTKSEAVFTWLDEAKGYWRREWTYLQPQTQAQSDDLVAHSPEPGTLATALTALLAVTGRLWFRRRS